MSPGHALVIDASVARAAGGLATVDPISAACRDTLFATRDSGHQMVMSRPIKDEWDNHASRFALNWLTDMRSRRRVLRLSNPVNEPLRAEISRTLPADTVERVLKDTCLIEAALVSDRRILSLNDQDRRHFQDLARHPNPDPCVVLRDVMWANPGIVEEEVIPWLTSGAAEESRRYLGYAHGG